MNESDKKKLQANYEKLVNDVKYYQVSAHLLSTFILDLRMDALIKSGRTEQEQMELLLALLPARGENAMREFIIALKKTSPWLAESLQEEKVHFNNDSNKIKNISQENIDKFRDISISDYILEIRRVLEGSPLICSQWIKLAFSMKLQNTTIADLQERSRFRSCIALHEILQSWLEERGDMATFANLIKILKKEKFESAAAETKKLWLELLSSNLMCQLS